MKIRSLHPDFFTDAKVSGLSFGARILFQGLWCRSDDYGRGRMLEKAIEGDVFPRDDVDITALLDELIQAGLIRSYQSGQDRFYFIPTWEKYQSPKYRAKSSIPEPSEDETPGQMDPGESGANLGESSQGLSPGEGEGEGVGEGVILAPRARDEVWDTLADIFGEPTTESNRSLRGKLNRSLKAAGATETEIRRRVQAWPLHFPDATLTETALEKHWDRLDRPPAKASEADVEKYQAEVRRLEREKRAQELDAGARGLPR